MPANVKNVILKKKISDTIYELRCKTIAAMVYVDDNTTLASQLTTMLADISDTAGKMAALLDGAEASSIATQISTAITTAVNAIEDDTDPTSIAGKLAAAQTAINAINDASTGILATAEAYTDTVAGISGTGYSTVKAYVDNAISTVTSDLAGAFHFKGSVNYVDLLPDPSTDTVEEGDVYQVLYRGTSTDAGTDPLNAEYAYNGTAFVELGTIVDLSSYSTTAQMTSAISAAQAAAEQTAAADATSKANAAQAAAEATAAADATSKANAAQAAAEATAAADATSKANAAQAAAEQTAATALASAVSTLETSIGTKARIILSTTQPADLTESDIWAQVIEDAPAEDPEEP